MAREIPVLLYTLLLSAPPELGARGSEFEFPLCIAGSTHGFRLEDSDDMYAVLVFCV